MYGHILLTTDGSDLANKAVQQGITLAAAIDARVTVLTAIQPLYSVAPAEVMIALPEADYMRGAQQHADQILEQAAAAAKVAGVACETRCEIQPEAWQAIIDCAVGEGCDLIVLGSHGRTGLSKLILGSQTQKVLSHTTIAVLVIR
ncbi:MAG: universal stress protein [Hyphomicrobiaceae bacterium]